MKHTALKNRFFPHSYNRAALLFLMVSLNSCTGCNKVTDSSVQGQPALYKNQIKQVPPPDVSTDEVVIIVEPEIRLSDEKKKELIKHIHLDLAERIKAQLDGINKLLIELPLNEYYKGQALIKLATNGPSHDIEIGNIHTELPLFSFIPWSTDITDIDPMVKKPKAPTGISIRLDKDRSKGRLVKVHYDAKDAFGLRVRVEAEDSKLLRNRCENTFAIKGSPDDNLAEKIRDFVSACTISIVFKKELSKTSKPYAMLLEAQESRSQANLYTAIAQYAEYVESKSEYSQMYIDSGLTKTGGSGGQQNSAEAIKVLKDSIHLFSGNKIPLARYLFVHAMIALCSEAPGQCQERQAELSQNIDSPYMNRKESRGLKALAYESIGDYPNANTIWEQMDRETLPSERSNSARSRFALINLAKAKNRSASIMRINEKVAQALSKHTELKQELEEQIRHAGGAAQEETPEAILLREVKIQIAIDHVVLAATVENYLPGAGLKRAIIHYVTTDLKALLEKIGSGESLVSQQHIDKCRDGSVVSCEALRREVDKGLRGIVNQHEEASWVALREVAGTMGEKNTQGSKWNLQNYLFEKACAEPTLWAKYKTDALQMIQQALQTAEPSWHNKLLASMAKCRTKEAMRGQSWPYGRWMEDHASASKTLLSSLQKSHGDSFRTDLGSTPSGNATLTLLTYPQAFRATTAYSDWVASVDREIGKKWIHKIGHIRSTEQLEDLATQVFQEMVQPQKLKGFIAALEFLKQDKHFHLSLKLLEQTEDTFNSWVETQATLKTPDISLREAIKRADDARSKLMELAFQDLRPILEPLGKMQAGTLRDPEVNSALRFGYLHTLSVLRSPGDLHVPEVRKWIANEEAAVVAWYKGLETPPMVTKILSGQHGIDELRSQGNLTFVNDWSKDEHKRPYVRTQREGDLIISRIPESTCRAEYSNVPVRERLNWFLAHVAMHKEWYEVNDLPDKLRSEARDLGKSYQTFCQRPIADEPSMLGLHWHLQHQRELQDLLHGRPAPSPVKVAGTRTKLARR